MKSDLSLIDQRKKIKSFLKKSSQIEFIFLVNFPMRREQFFLSPVVYKKLNKASFCGLKCNFESKINTKKI